MQSGCYIRARNSQGSSLGTLLNVDPQLEYHRSKHKAAIFADFKNHLNCFTTTTCSRIDWYKLLHERKNDRDLSVQNFATFQEKIRYLSARTKNEQKDNISDMLFRDRTHLQNHLKRKKLRIKPYSVLKWISETADRIIKIWWTNITLPANTSPSKKETSQILGLYYTKEGQNIKSARWQLLSHLNYVMN